MRFPSFISYGLVLALAACTPDDNQTNVQNQMPSASLSLSTSTLFVGNTLALTVDCTDPESRLMTCSITQMNPDQSLTSVPLTESTEQLGHWSGTSILNAVGQYEFSAQAVDQESGVGNSDKVTVVVTLPGEPPVVEKPNETNLPPTVQPPSLLPDLDVYAIGAEVVVSTICDDLENSLQTGIDGCYIEATVPNGKPSLKLASGATITLSEMGVYEFKAYAVDTVLQMVMSTTVSVNVANNPPRLVTLSVSSVETLLGNSVRLTANATDVDGNLVSLKICEVITRGDECTDVVAVSTPQSTLRGIRNEVSSTLITRRFYAQAQDASGVTRKSNEKTVTWRGNLYVSMTGDDLNPGTEVEPLRTIQGAVNKAMVGDYIVVEAGTYREKVTISKNNITLDGQGVAIILSTDNNPPSNNVDNPGVFSVLNADTVVIRGFNVGNKPTSTETPYSMVKGFYGIYVGDGANNVVIENNKVYLTVSSGIVSRNGSNVTVLNNLVEKTNVGFESFYNPAQAFNQGYDVANCEARYEREKDFRARQEMISIWNTVDFVVRGNELFNGLWTINGMCVIGKEGIDAKDGSRNGKIVANRVHDILKLGIYLDAYEANTGNIDVDSNRVWNTRHGLVLAVESSETMALFDIRVTNNMFFKNKEHGIFIAPFGNTAKGTGNGLRSNIKILNNTIYENNNAGILIGESSNFGEANINGVVIYNNFVARNGAKQILNNTTKTVVAGNNLVATGDSQGNIVGRVGKPTFVDVTSANISTWNFQLVANPAFSTSDAIDEGFGGVVNYLVSGVGTSITVGDVVLKDAAGLVRLTGNNTELDIGAYEKH